jgi:hypothetical protein
MNEKLILWAQALDNTCPDHFDVRGEEIPADDSSRRQEAVSSVSAVIKNAKGIYKGNGILLTADAHHFVIEVPSAQLDCAGRTAPIVCYGAYDAAVGDELVTSVAIALEHFARRINRTLQPDHLKLVRTAFEDLKKKSSETKFKRTVWIGAGVVLLLAIVYWLSQRNG